MILFWIIANNFDPIRGKIGESLSNDEPDLPKICL